MASVLVWATERYAGVVADLVPLCRRCLKRNRLRYVPFADGDRLARGVHACRECGRTLDTTPELEAAVG